MKKLVGFVFGFLMFLSVMLISFVPVKNSANKQACASVSIENQYFDENSIELVSKNPTSFVGASADRTPFDKSRGQLMEGSSITPTADDYGQVKSFSYGLCSGNGYTPELDDNILMWIYFIDAITFKLEISLDDGSFDGLVWEFDAQKIYEIGTGWRLVALKLSDHRTEIATNPKTYNYITFKYLSEASEFEGEEGYESYQIKTDERFSFYHIFASKNANKIKNTGILHRLDTSFYKFSENFNIGKNAFVGDKIKLDVPSKIFEYLYIGKNDLSDYLASGKYYWSVTLRDSDMVNANIDFGDTINFYKKGFHHLSIQMFEKLTIGNKRVLSVGVNVYVDEMCLGKYSMAGTYSIKDDEKIVVALTLSDALIDLGELSVTLNNNNAEIESYYEEDGVVYVCLYGKSSGLSDLTISAEGKTKFNDDTQTFSSIATISVDYTDSGVDVFNIVLWVLFIGFCAEIIIYLLISVVKARRNDVR